MSALRFAPRVSLAAALLAGLALAPSLARAHKAPDRTTLSAELRALTTPEKDFESLSRLQNADGVQRQYGLDTHLLRRYFLRSPELQPQSSLAPRQVAEDFLAAHAGELGLSAVAPLQGLALAYEKQSPSGTHLRYDQVVDDVPAYRSEIVIKINGKGQVSSVQNNLVPGLKLGTKPGIVAATALDVAKNLVKPTGRDLAPATARLNVVDFRGGARLAWLVSMPVEQPMGDWLVFVDANTGVVFGGEDRMRYAEGTGRVFDPDPMTKMNDSSFVDNNDADASVPFPAAYDIVPLHGITLSAGIYSLSGPYAQLIDDESPTGAPVTATQPDSFRFQRNAQGFEDVMCYFQIDNSQRYIQSLGFTNVDNRVQPIDSHGLSGADNSHYVPSTGHLAFGEGGVDDDEDADVIWHEYGHSIQDNIVPGWGGGQEGQMGEGWGDYWAGSYSWFKNSTFQINRVFTWDGNGDTWTGRRLTDPSMHYPENCCGEVHDSGTLWCSGLIDVLRRVGRPVMDAIVLDHHFALGTSATMADAANQVIQSDIDLFGGAHVSTIVDRFGVWGFVNPADFVPTITHTPLVDVESVVGPYPVVATVTSVKPLAAGSPRMFWGFGAAITDSALMTPTANSNEYAANIPGPGSATNIVYYLRARDTNGGSAYKPTTAPATPYTFHVGADVTPPAIAHTPITIAPAVTWPATVAATVTDNLGVNTTSVTVTWTLNAVGQAPFTLARVGLTNNYSASFPAVAVVPGDAVMYHITAQDVAAIPNTGRSPAVGENAFTITASLGAVLVLDDDELAKRAAESKTIADEKDPSKLTTLTTSGDNGILSANVIASWFTAMGYVASVAQSGTSNPATWPGYSFIVSASGGNLGPVANATYRSALESYVAAGHKLLVEGGEVGYDAISSPGYPSFAATVLHGTSWAADNAGPLQRIPAQALHPLATVPNALPANIPITYVSPNYGTEDSYAPVAPAIAVYGTTTQPNNVGIGAFDNDTAPQAGQVVVLAFDIKDVTDSTVAKQVLQNAAHYLLAAQPPALSVLSGRVALGPAWGGGGIAVAVTPGGFSGTTAADGTFEFDGLYAGNYSVSASTPGYSGSARNVTLGQAQQVSVIMRLFTTASVNNCNNPALSIPDNTPAGVTNAMSIVPAFPLTSVQLSVNITHTYQGDLIVELRHGATNVRVHNRTGGTTDNIIGTYPTTLTPANSLGAFNGQSSAGTWTLFVSDNASVDVGTVNQWCLTLAGASDTTLTTGADVRGLPETFAFAPVWPNPAHGGNVSMSFALPKASPVKVALYDVTGRLVRTVADRAYDAGRYTLVWDGRDARGAALKPGVYLARFSSAGHTQSRRVLIVP